MSNGPPPVRTIAFNSLPATTRQRFIDAVSGRATVRPILSQPTLTTGGGVGYLVFAAVLGLVLMGMIQSSATASIYRTGPLEGPFGIVLFGAVIFGIAISVFAAFKRFAAKRALPYTAGKYLFATDLVVAESETLTLVPMGLMKDFNGVHQHYNGVYSYTSLNFTFQGWGMASFIVHGKHLADQALANMQTTTRAISDAAKAKDVHKLRELDVFHDAFAQGVMDKPGLAGLDALVAEQGGGDTKGPLANEMPKFFKWGWAASAVAGLLAALPTWYLTASATDAARLGMALRSESTSYLEEYVRNGGDQVDAVTNEYAPIFVYRAALRRNSVTALRDFIRTNPNSRYVTEARGLIRETFVRVRQRFETQAAADPQMRAFMTALLTYLESNDSPPVAVRFRPPTSDTLSQVDAQVVTDGRRLAAGREIVAVAPHFTEATSGPREREITQGLQRGFGAVFPNDVLSLRDGARIDGASPATVSEPTIEVAYEVRPSGSYYSLRSGNRAFVGIVVDFSVIMRLPGSAQTFGFTTRVQPPERFSFSYDTYRGSSSGPSDGRVYSVMAERAFEQLSSHMAGVFFQNGSQAYRSLATSTPARNSETN